MSVRDMIRTRLATARSKALFEGFLARADQARQDTHQVERLRRPECKSCFYLQPPQATATDLQHCGGCKAALIYKDEFCRPCALHRNICRRCGGRNS